MVYTVPRNVIGFAFPIQPDAMSITVGHGAVLNETLGCPTNLDTGRMPPQSKAALVTACELTISNRQFVNAVMLSCPRLNGGTTHMIKAAGLDRVSYPVIDVDTAAGCVLEMTIFECPMRCLSQQIDHGKFRVSRSTLKTEIWLSCKQG